MKSNRKNVSWKLALFALYVSAVAVRFLLALLTRKQISISIDEFLYTGLARSIAAGSGLLFRGQTADYSYLTYPLFLSPIYALFPSGTNFFRLLQLWSIMLIQASVFPIYGIAAKLFGEHGKKPLCAAALCLLLSDFIIGNILFSECLIYPLFFAAVYLALREAESPNPVNALGIGACAGLMYETKPGQVVFPVVFILLSAFFAIREKNKKATANACISAVTGLAIILIFRLLIGSSASFGVYENQLTLDFHHFDRFLYGCALYPVCFILACGVGCFIWPLKQLRTMSAPAKRVLIASLISLAVLIIGTSWVINRYESNSNQIHTRYIAMFVPIMLLYTYSSSKDADGPKAGLKRKNLVFCSVIVVWTAVCCLVPGLSDFRNKTDSSYYAAFSSLYLLVSPENSALKIISAILIPAFAALMCYFVFTQKKNASKMCVCVLVGIMSVNNVLGYVEIGNSLGNNAPIHDSGNEILESVGDDDYVFISSDLLYGAYNTLSVNSLQESSYVLWTDLFNALNRDAGVFKPFVPTMDFRGVLQDRKLIDTDLLIMDDAVFNLLKPSSNTQVFTTPKLSAVRIKPGERWVDSIIGNLIRYKLEKGLPGILVIFDEETLKSPIRIRMNVNCDQDATLIVRSAAETVKIPLTEGTQWVEAKFDKPMSTYNFIANDCDINVYEYEILH